jgi:hypothetical protein
MVRKMLSAGMLLRVVVVRTVFLRRVLRLLVTADFPSSSILVSLMMEALRSSQTSVLTGATRRNTPQEGILHSPSGESLNSYTALTGWSL